MVFINSSRLGHIHGLTVVGLQPNSGADFSRECQSTSSRLIDNRCYSLDFLCSDSACKLSEIGFWMLEAILITIVDFVRYLVKKRRWLGYQSQHMVADRRFAKVLGKIARWNAVPPVLSLQPAP
jgi:hypothetical protein